MSSWYWRDGTLAVDSTNPQWLAKMRDIEMRLEDRDYKVVKQDTLANGLRVSTVWLGLDHQFGDGPPLIFETMVFPSEGYSALDVQRYSTEAEALAGHEAMKAQWNK